MIDKNTRKIHRQKRIRTKIRGTSDRPRLTVFRSNKHIYAQVIDDAKKITIVSAYEVEKGKAQGKLESAKAVGMDIAKKAIEKKVKAVVFDKGSYAYHGRVRALAEGAREGGLQF
jgi:large subunit ribosomal protein L18